MPFAIYEAITFDFTQPSMLAWMSIVYYALIVTVVGFVLWYYGVSKVPASTSGVFTAIISVSALLLSSLFLNEELQWGHVVGVLFVLFGIFITATSRQKDASASHSITG
ncbi:EamA-like transporter family protein [compost metagenome]